MSRRREADLSSEGMRVEKSIPVFHFRLACDFCHCLGFVCFVPFEDFRKSKKPGRAKALL